MSPTQIGDQPHGIRPRHRQLAQVHHGWLMLVLCGPVLAIIAGLVATGVVSAGGLFFALPCLAMMAGMMFFRGHGHGDTSSD
jgi:hypothetical protein